MIVLALVVSLPCITLNFRCSIWNCKRPLLRMGSNSTEGGGDSAFHAPKWPITSGYRQRADMALNSFAGMSALYSHNHHMKVGTFTPCKYSHGTFFRDEIKPKPACPPNPAILTVSSLNQKLERVEVSSWGCMNKCIQPEWMQLCGDPELKEEPRQTASPKGTRMRLCLRQRYGGSVKLFSVSCRVREMGNCIWTALAPILAVWSWSSQISSLRLCFVSVELWLVRVWAYSRVISAAQCPLTHLLVKKPPVFFMVLPSILLVAHVLWMLLCVSKI